MAYHTYTTPALVCGSWSQNGADKTFLLYTQALGMVYATARSVREERSKQRYALQDFAQVHVSLVRGKAGWRIGSVIDVSQPYARATTRATRGSVVRLYRLVRRFVSGSEASAEFYTMVVEALDFLTHPNLQQRELVQDCVCFRLLYHLGYVAPTPAQQWVLEVPLTELDKVAPAAVVKSIQVAITQAEEASHL